MKGKPSMNHDQENRYNLSKYIVAECWINYSFANRGSQNRLENGLFDARNCLKRWHHNERGGVFLFSYGSVVDFGDCLFAWRAFWKKTSHAVAALDLELTHTLGKWYYLITEYVLLVEWNSFSLKHGKTKKYVHLLASSRTLDHINISFT